MKILVFSHLFPNRRLPHQGLFVLERVKALSALAKDLKVVAPIAWFPFCGLFRKYRYVAMVEKVEHWDGIEVLHPRFVSLPGLHAINGCLYFLSLWLQSRIRSLVKASDLLDIHWTYPDAFGSGFFASLSGKPMVVTVRGHEAFYEGAGSLRERMVLFSLRKAAGVIAVSEELRKKTLEKAGLPGHRVKTVVNGVDLENFRLGDRMAARRELGLDPDRGIVLSVGRICDAKGFHFLVDAWPDLLARHPDTDLVIIGAPDREDPNYIRALQIKIETLGLQERIVFAGEAPPKKLTIWYAACDVFCLATKREGCPNVVLEALASGRPVVASAVGGIPDILTDPETGILVDPEGGGFAPALISALDKGWDEGYIRARMERRGWKWCAENALAAIKGFLAGGHGRKQHETNLSS